MNESSLNQSSRPVSNQGWNHNAIIRNIVVIIFGLTINYINGTLIYASSKHQAIYSNPRYILFIHLVINDMIHLTTSVLLFVCSYIFRKIHGTLCSIIISFAIWTTMNSPLNIAAMALQCYIAICFPLRYPVVCTVKRTHMAIACIWVLGSIAFVPDIFLMVSTDYREVFLSLIYCERNNLFRHPDSSKKREVLYSIYLVIVWIVIFYTYIQIFIAAKAVTSDGDMKKARNTILLHSFQLMLCILTYVYHFIVRFLIHLFPRSVLNVSFVSFIMIQILPRLISPIVYGLRDQLFRQSFNKHFLCGVCLKQ